MNEYPGVGDVVHPMDDKCDETGWRSTAISPNREVMQRVRSLAGWPFAPSTPFGITGYIQLSFTL